MTKREATWVVCDLASGLPVCTENLIHVDEVAKSPKPAQ